MNIEIKRAIIDDLNWINTLYQSIGFIESDLNNEVVLILEVTGIPAGIGRINFIDENVAELGGIYILPEFRSNGFARIIVKHLIDEIRSETDLYCLPFSHLKKFYFECGFIEHSNNSKVPKEIHDKYVWCNNTYESEVLLLKRESSITLEALSEDNLDRVHTFEVENRVFFEQVLDPRADLYWDINKFKDLMRTFIQGECYMFNIKLNDIMIGRINFSTVSYINDESVATLGYRVGEKFINRGYVTEAVRQIINFAKEIGINKIIAGTSSSNIGSQRVLEKCLFHLLLQENSGNELFYELRL